MKPIRTLLTALLLSPLAALQAANLTFAGIFTDHAVLQRDVAVPVWGWANPNEQVSVAFAGRSKSATADATGKWLVRLDPMPASSEGRELVVLSPSENRKSKITDVVVGDVWLCSGQSNMGIPMSVPGNDSLQLRIAEADNPRLRLFATLHQFPESPLQHTQGRWSAATSDAVKNWIAIGYLFGERIQRETGVPVGILVSCMGGTCIESWLPREVLLANPANRSYLDNHAKAVERLPEAMKRYEKELADFKQHVQSSQKEPRKPDGLPNSARNPSACYNGKIAPILPYALKGMLWYQGEGNVWGFAAYPSQMADLMRCWRERFELPRLPFIMTELAPLGQPSANPQDSARARFGEALAKTAKADGNAWVITIVDGGDPLDIHPVKKEIPAERFAAMALAKVYGKAGIAHGPLLESWNATGGKVVVKFASAGGGLVAKTVDLGGHQVAASKLQGFELAGADKKFFRADARIEDNDTVIVASPDVSQPAAVRYAWAAFPLCNLFNTDGFAAYPFRTDDWPWQTPPDAAKPAAEAGKKNQQANQPAGRIMIRDGRFVMKTTGATFSPVGVNYFRTGTVKMGKKVHAAFSPGFYDPAFVEEMMRDLAANGFNTVRAFLSHHAGEDGIVSSPASGDIHPAFLANVLHLLGQAKQHGIHVIFTWDTWPPESRTWASLPLGCEAANTFFHDLPPNLGLNSFRLSLAPVRIRAHAITALIQEIRNRDPSLLPAVLAWELENEVYFVTDKEPFLSRPAGFQFAGRTFDLTTDAGMQELMDTAVREWATTCAAEIHRVDPEALVSASAFAYSAVGRIGPGTLSRDQTKDVRIPARPQALLRSGLDFVDIHIYGGKTKTESVRQQFQRTLESVEIPALLVESKTAGKPLLAGETGVAAHYLRRPPNWQEIHHDEGVEQLRELSKGLRAAGFAGALLWHYGNPDSSVNDEFPALKLFPQYGEPFGMAWHDASQPTPSKTP